MSNTAKSVAVLELRGKVILQALQLVRKLEKCKASKDNLNEMSDIIDEAKEVMKQWRNLPEYY